MNDIKIICDSMSGVTFIESQMYNIKVMPLKIDMDNKVYLDGVDINSKDFLELMDINPNKMPKTSQIPPSEFKEVFIEELKSHSKIIYIASSSVASGTYQSSLIAKNELVEEGIAKEENIILKDALNLSRSVAITVIDTARKIKETSDIENILGQIDYLAGKTKTYLSVSDMKHLISGGRISSMKGKIGGILKLMPIIEVKDGVPQNINIVRGEKKVVSALYDIVCENYDFGDIEIMAGLDRTQALKLKEKLSEKFNEVSVVIDYVSPVLSAHTGTTGVGVSFIGK